MLLLAYLLWLANAALALVTAAQIRAAIAMLGIPLHWGPYTFTLVDEVLLILLGLGWLIWVLIMESRYRRAAGRGKPALLRSVVRTTALLLAVSAVAFAVQRLVPL